MEQGFLTQSIDYTVCAPWCALKEFNVPSLEFNMIGCANADEFRYIRQLNQQVRRMTALELNCVAIVTAICNSLQSNTIRHKVYP